MDILGISAFYHDSAACLLRDGEIVAAVQEERFTRRKHDWSFPARAVEACLREGGTTADQLDYVAFYDKPLLKFERLLESWIATAPRSFGQFRKGMPLWLSQKLHLPREIRRGLGGRPRHPIVFLEHHESHAASAFLPSPFEEAAILTMDGVGEWATASIGHGRGQRVELLQELRFPHSLGLLYSAFTAFCGFRVNSGEYKLMGLAPYGEPAFAGTILDELVDLRPDGSLRLDMAAFDFLHGDRMHGARFEELFGGPAREPESPLTRREMDLAASIQQVTEEAMLRMARHAHERTGSPNLCLAGGVALNCVGNGRILREGPFERIWIQPAAGDAGGALGAALFTWHQLVGRPRTPASPDGQAASLLGPGLDPAAERQALLDRGAVLHDFPDEGALCEEVARRLDEGLVVGHCHGRMEFGPRALGNRSILGDARSPAMQRTMNLKIKFRESFRPFAPVVLAERAHEWFTLREDQESPYMLLVAHTHPARRRPVDDDRTGLERLGQPRSEVPAITHVDDSARIQTVHGDRHPRLHGILSAFERRTGCPVLINTSFNVRGEPIVADAADAWRCFLATGMDALVVGNSIAFKAEQPGAERFDADAHLAQFALD